MSQCRGISYGGGCGVYCQLDDGHDGWCFEERAPSISLARALANTQDALRQAVEILVTDTCRHGCPHDDCRDRRAAIAAGRAALGEGKP